MFDSNNKNDIQIDWTPLKGGGASFATRKLVGVSPSRYEFKSTIGARLFSLFFIIFPLFWVRAFINSTLPIKITENPTFINNTFPIEAENLMTVFPMLISFIFLITGIVMLVFFSRPVVFDKSVGFFWKGFRQPSPVYSGNKRKKAVRIEEIHGLQIVKELVHAKNSYTSFELNLVLNNNERINVIDHGNLRRVKEDAQKLGLFLGVPVWDQMSGV